MAPKPKSKQIWSKGYGLSAKEKADQERWEAEAGDLAGRQVANIGITIAGARNLVNKDKTGNSDPYCTCEVLDADDQVRPKSKPIQTHVIEDNNNPEWDYREIINDFIIGDKLRFTVYDSDSKTRREFLGSVVLATSDFFPAAFEGDVDLEGEGKSWGREVESTLSLKIYALTAAREKTKVGDYSGDDRRKNQMRLSIEQEIPMPKDPYDDARAARRRRDPFIDEVIQQPEEPVKTMTGDEWKLTMAVIKLQRFWRLVSYNWLSSRTPVKLPPSCEDFPDVLPSAMGDTLLRRGPRAHAVAEERSRDVTWHGRLRSSARAVKSAGASGLGKRLAAQIAHLQEVGKFAAACRAGVVMAVQTTLLDPHGSFAKMQPYQVHDEETRDKLPRRITRDDPLWPHLRGRFDGDRIYLFDSIVITLIGGDVVGETDAETALRIYQHDMSAYQALADTMHLMNPLNPIAQPFAVVVDYMGFRAICRPQMLYVGSKPPELVIGPLAEARSAYTGPGDFPEMYRTAQSVQRTEVSLLVNAWEENHQDLRRDFETISGALHLQGLPVVLDATDLPDGCETTALVRIAGELHFRTPSELLPPEVLTDAGLADPTRRLRREALDTLNAPPLPSTHRLTTTAGDRLGEGGTRLLAFSAHVAQELPRRFVERLEAEGAPLDSRGWTEALHTAGLNCRHIGWVAQRANSPAITAALTREALARATKWLLRQRLWSRTPWTFLASQQNAMDSVVGPEAVASRELVSLFNAILGGGEVATRFWNQQLVPETVRRFGISPASVEKPRVFAGGLFLAMQYHCKVRFRSWSANKHFFDPGLPEPFTLDDLMPFRSMAAQPFFPHLQVVQERLAILQARYAGLDETQGVGGRLAPIRLRGFLPESRIVCARGPEWQAACASPAKHVKEGRWDRAYEALNLRLSMSRGIGDPAAVVGGALQGIAVALMKLAKNDSPDSERGLNLQRASSPRGVGNEYDQTMPQQKFKKLADPDKALHAMWASDAAMKLLPNTISAWWGQLAAVEAEWLLERHVAAESRMTRLQKEWERLANDQPMLQLRLQDTFAKLLSADGDWRSAAVLLEKCTSLCELAFGRTHPATISYYARLGDSWARREEWEPATRAFRNALALAESCQDTLASARIGYELANALHRFGDAAAAKAHAETVVWKVLPRLHASDGNQNLRHTPGGAFALDALHLLARIYEDIFLRATEVGHLTGLQKAELREIAKRSISCYESLLRQLPLMMKDKSARLSREGRIVESILRLKTLDTGPSERHVLEDAIEGLIVSSHIANDPKLGAMKGVRALQPRLQTRAVASAALRTTTADLQSRIESLCEAVARDAALNGLAPSAWFDVIVTHLSEGGYWGLTNLDDPMHQSTLQMLDLCRHFMGNNAQIF